MKLVKSFALIFLITILIVTFQNCTIRQNTGLLGSKTTDKSQAEIVVEQAPFAYDMAIDTISYNSCVGSDLKSSGIHGIKMGVNEGFTGFDSQTSIGVTNAGVKLRTEFLQYIGRSIPPNYPSNVITPAQIQYVLSSSPKNKNSQIQYSVRKRMDLSVVVDQIQPNTSALNGRDGLVNSASLTSSAVTALLTKNVIFGPGGAILVEGPRIYNLSGKTAPSAIEAAFNYSNAYDDTFDPSSGVDNVGTGEQYSDNIRKKFNSGGSDKIILAATFGTAASSTGLDNGLSTPKRPSDTDKTQAYGRGYELKFVTSSAKAGWRENRLSTVKEIPLVSGESTGNWANCENFVIMKQSHWNNTKVDEAGCASLTAADLQNSILKDQVRRIRRHYAEADWNVGLYYGKKAAYVPAARGNQGLCLVPKRGECYLPTTGLTADGSDIGVQYDPGQECYLSRYQIMGVTYTGGLSGDAARKLGRCAQYASICVRQ